MRVSLNQHERGLATVALDLGDKKCDAARKSLEELHVEPFDVQALQGVIVELRTQLRDLKETVFDWEFPMRRGLAICLRIYRDQLTKLAKKEAELIVTTDATEEKRGDIGDFLARLAGQENFWRESEAEGDSEPTKK